MSRRTTPLLYSPSPLSRSSIATDIHHDNSYPDNHFHRGQRTDSPESETESSLTKSKSGTSSRSGGTEDTIEDVDGLICFGHPLQRMDHTGSVYRGSSGSGNSESLLAPPNEVTNGSTSSVASSIHCIDYDAMIDLLHNLHPAAPEHTTPYVTVTASTSGSSTPSIMIKMLPHTSEELKIFLKLNRPKYRADPWNPAPYLLRNVDRQEGIFICLEQLMPYNKPPFRTVANYIDFFGQVLEGLTFLHELSVVNLECSNPASFMVDLNAGPCCDHECFDRERYPVKYYFVGFSNAHWLQRIDHSSSDLKKERMFGPVDGHREMFANDVKQLGNFINTLLKKVPQVAPKFKALVAAMTTGGFTADDARRLFEALCQSLEATVFDIPVADIGDINDMCPIGAIRECHHQGCE